MTRPLPPRPNLLQLKHQAKDLRKAQVAGDAEALALIRQHLPRCAQATDQEILARKVSLQEAQHVIACDYGFKHWEMLCAVVEADLDMLAYLYDREAQHLMRQIDQKDMTTALIGAGSAVQDRFLLNISARVRGFLRAEMEMSKADTERIEEARRTIVQLAAESAVRGEINWPDGPTLPPSERVEPQYKPSEELRQIAGRPLDQLNGGDIEDLFSGLSAQAHREGILSLNEYADSIDDPFLRMALQLAVDGCEPDLMCDMLETRLNFAILPHLKTRGTMAMEGTMAIYSGDNPLIVRHKLAVFVAQPSPDWGDLDVDQVTLEKLLALLREKSPEEMTLENLADFYALMAKLTRDEGIAALQPLCKELLQERDLIGELMRYGLQMMGDEVLADQVMKAMLTQLDAHLDGSEKAHRMVIGGVRAIQEGKEAKEVVATVRALA